MPTPFPMRYDPSEDIMVEVDQEWVDLIIKRCFQMKKELDALQKPEAGAHDGSGRAQSEVREESRDSAENSKGVQSSRQREMETKGQVACAYAVTVDGFIAIRPKAIRNPQSPFVVWMSEAVWQKLANCATAQGQFYIPRTDTIDAPEVLRLLVKQEEANKC